MGPAAGKARGRRRTRSGDPGRARREGKELEGERSPRPTSRRKWPGPSAQSRGGEQLGPKGPVPSRGQGPWGHRPASPQLLAQELQLCPGSRRRRGGGGAAAGRWQLEEEPRDCPVCPGGGRAVLA